MSAVTAETHAEGRAPPPARPARGRAFARLLGAAYLIGLFLVIFAMRVIGERTWAVALLLYLPRIGFAFPLPIVLLGHFLTNDRRRGIVVLLVSAPLIFFTLMGYQLGGRHETATPVIRVMSWNTYFGRLENETIRYLVAKENPDIFIAQATAKRTRDLFTVETGGYTIDHHDEYFLATRFPIVEKYVPPNLPEDPAHAANFVRWTLQTPFGLVDVYDIHPRSPRVGLASIRGRGLRTRLTEGDLPDEAVQPAAENTILRRRQVAAQAAEIRASKNPVIVAGDTNLPTLSWLFHEGFSQLQDGFSEAGSGFGYTFPAKYPWLRIDRILADRSFRFLSFHSNPAVASDHLYVVAELAKP